MRRLAIGLLAAAATTLLAGALAGPTASAQADDEPLAPVDVLQVSGLLDTMDSIAQ